MTDTVKELFEALRPEAPSGEIAISDLENACKKIYDLRDEVSRMKVELSLKNEELDKAEREAMAMLEAADKTKYVSEVGTIYTSVHESVAIPKDDAKVEFMKYLKEIDLYDQVVTVNSQWLNGWYRREKEAALERGDVLFSIPGLDNPHTSVRLNFRKG